MISPAVGDVVQFEGAESPGVVDQSIVNPGCPSAHASSSAVNMGKFLSSSVSRAYMSPQAAPSAIVSALPADIEETKMYLIVDTGCQRSVAGLSLIHISEPTRPY